MDISELYQIYQAHPVITTDSRDCPEGSIFLALKGASFDGNKFADMALEKGCAYVIVDEKEYAKEGDERYILVEDCLTTFKELAREHRRHFDIPVVGITGTNGKTTTKELVSAVLGEKFNVMFTQGNFNNDVGVPKTLFRLSPENEIAVVEMGASHPDDIRKLVEYVEPTCGMITNVGRAHLQGFGSFEGVKKTKGELYDYLAANDALVFINADNEHLMQMAEQRNINRLITYGKDENCDVWGEVISCAPFLKFRWRTESFDWHEVQTHLIGSYNIDNMLAAITIGLHFDVKPQQIDHALGNYIPSNNRSQLEETAHNKLVVDADLVVSEGFIEPHFFAGFSGARKSILPGIASRTTVLANHRELPRDGCTSQDGDSRTDGRTRRSEPRGAPEGSRPVAGSRSGECMAGRR